MLPLNVGPLRTGSVLCRARIESRRPSVRIRDHLNATDVMSEEPSTSSANGKRKRQRVSQACERCRAKKYRCDGAGPPCAACHTAGTACNYGQAGQRRGLKTGYVKVLEMLWGLALEEVPNSEYVATQLLATLSRDDLDSNSPAALQTWRNSGLPSRIASLLDDEPSEHHARESARSPLLAPTWRLDPVAAAEDPPERTSVDTRAQTSTSEQSIPPVNTQILLPRAEDPSAFPPLPAEWHLRLQAYLSHEESWLPILPKSSIWRMAYAYEASSDASSDRVRAPGDDATLWAALMLGEMHVNRAMSVGTEVMRTRAHAFLTPMFSSEPDVSYAPAFLLWSVIHMGRREFTLAKMKLVQANVLATSHQPTISSTGESLLTNACFVMDVLLALATNSRPLDIGSNSPAGEVRQGEHTDWEPFVDPLRQQRNPSDTALSLQSRPNRTYSTYDQLLKLCTLLHTFFRGANLGTNLETSFNDWSACLPHHLRFGTPSNPPDQGPQLPSEANIQIFSLLLHSRIAASGADTSTHDAHPTCDRITGTGIAKAFTSLQLHWDIRRLPLSFGVVIHLLSVDLTKHPADSSFEDSQSSLRKLVADFAAHYAWRSAEKNNEPTLTLHNNSVANEPLPRNLFTTASDPHRTSISTTQQVTGDQGAAQRHSGDLGDMHPTFSHETQLGGNRSSTFAEPDFGHMKSGDLRDPMISDLDDSLFPGAYLDLFDSDERHVHAKRSSWKVSQILILHSGNRDFMRALGFLEDTDRLGVADST
jgi:hypothetical protein